MNESEEAALLITFGVDIFSAKHLIPTCIHSPTGSSIKGLKTH